jgi:hypothetical protein
VVTKSHDTFARVEEKSKKLVYGLYSVLKINKLSKRIISEAFIFMTMSFLTSVFMAAAK